MRIPMYMIVAWVIAVLSVFSYDAFGDEVEFRVTDMYYTWGENHKFPVTAYQVGYTKYIDNAIGFRVMAGESDKRSDGHTYSSRITQFFVFNIHRSLKLSNNMSFQYGLNYTEYKENGKSDTGTGYGIAIQYRLGGNVSAKLSYDDYYEKRNEHFGLEETRGTGISIVVAI